MQASVLTRGSQAVSVRCKPTGRGWTSKLTCSAVKLYTNPGSRGKFCEWYLAELALPYETVLLDMRAGQHKSPEYLAINPFGKVPALVDDELPLFESGAILLHLANKYGKLSANELGVAAQWTLFANSTFSEAFFVRGPTQAAAGLLTVLDNILSKQKTLSGNKFGPGDVAVAGYLLYLPLFFPDYDLSKYPNVFRYMKEAAERPTCPEAYKQAMQSALAKQEGPAGLLKRMFK